MAVTPLTVITFCAISHCLFFQIPAKDITVTFQLNASTANRLRHDVDARFVSGSTFELSNATKSLQGRGSDGRVAYAQPIPLWNNSTKAVADFSTHFQFQINWTNQTTSEYHDKGGSGFAFFMASPDSGYHVPYTQGGRWFGLFNERSNGDKSNQLVAVEFDTYQSPWDPDSNHVGIDVNSVISVDIVSLDQKLNDGKIWNARINYHGQENMLNVFVSCRLCNGRGPSMLSHKIKLTEYLPENIVVGFSAAVFESSEVQRLISWNFTSVIATSTTSLSKKRKIASKLITIVVSICCLVTIISVISFVIHFYRRRKRLTSEEEESDVVMVLDHVPRKFSYAELSTGTNNFSEKEKLGQGGFGDVYKGVLMRSDEVVAVKRISAGSKQGKKEYVAEITTITRLRHRNLVQLLGWCHEKSQLLLVYEYMPNGSLDNFLFEKRRGDLNWTCRYRIASDIASALLYLHELWDECVVHRDVKSSNVMLDSEFNAKLGDFGLARLVKHDQWLQTSTIAGTLGYLAPECAVTGISSTESDVFSFGAVALEIACGRQTLDLRLEKQKMRLVEWVWDLYGQGRLFDAADSGLNGEFNRAEMEMLMVIGLWCSHPDPSTRPRIRQVLQLLNFEIPMPNLPNTLPKAAYSPIEGGFFNGMSDFPLTHANSQEMAVFSCSALTDMPSTSSSSTAMSKSSMS
ncbi:hypothetical protein KI387_008165 [Taxus chinensis]|uniref:non-specific serine/threonine protein kinase n=1 Tax=Taxus chinensis TaxID=29808 RepID=A0AA38FIS2_TAXCH|nr:hypothetical protein KI387_008165 [Taxus chinensis]